MDQDSQRRSASEVQHLLKQKTKQIEQHLQALKDEVSGITPSIRETMHKHPLLTVGGTLAAGVLVGMLLSRQRGDLYSPAMVDACLAPMVATVKARMAAGESAEEAVRAAFRTQPPVSAMHSSSLSSELIRMLLPMLAGWVAQAFR